MDMRKQICIMLLVASWNVQAQLDPLYNQYLMNQAMVNPAYIGVHNMGHISAITRGQWIGVEGGPYTHTLSAYSSVSDHSSVGLLFVNDNFGINTNTDILFSYAYKLDLGGASSLSFGLQGGPSIYTQDFNKLTLEVNDDPAIGSGINRSTQTNFGAGLMYSNDFFYLGVASPRMTNSIIEQDGILISEYKPSYNLTSGILLSPTDAIKLKPSGLVRYQDEKIAVDLSGQMLINEKVWLGVTSRNFSSGGISFIYNHLYIYNFGYSFEFPFGAIGRGNYGIHELMFSVDLRLSDKHKLNDRFF
jgi:type IX secretion system PorP/SprF family membrane protein